MDNISTHINLLWWISVVEIPALGSLFALFWHNTGQTTKNMAEIREFSELQITKIRESLSSYKLEVAKNYASITYLNAVEKRLTEHLLRIENKLDRNKCK